MAEIETDSRTQSTLNNEELPHAAEKNSGGGKSQTNGVDGYPHGLRLFLLAGASIMGVFLISLDQTVVGTAIPKITDEFGGLYDVSCLGQGLQVLDLKKTFILSIVIFEVGSLICGAAPNSKTLIVGRTIAGRGAQVPPCADGFIGLTYGVASALGPLLGSVFTDKVTWRWCFYINLPIGGVTVVVVFVFYQLPNAARPLAVGLGTKLWHMDPIGIVLAMAAITYFILGLQYAGTSLSWSSSEVVGLLVGFGAISIALVLWETYLDDYSMLIPRLFKKRAIWSIAPYQFLFMGSLILLAYYLPIYFQSIRGASPIDSGVYNLPMVISVGIFCVIGGMVVSKTGHATPSMFAGAAVATIGIGLLYTLDLDTPVGKWIGYQILTGSAIAFSVQNALNIAQANVGSEDLAAVVANIYFFQTVGGAFSTPAGQAAFVNQMMARLASDALTVDPGLVIATGATQLRSIFTPEELPGILLAYMHGLRAVFALGIAMAGVSCLATVFIPWSRLPTHAPSLEDGPLADV
ncbi:hypothetical protein ACJZ2D_001146 [Fusarium nematophilum]